MRARHRHVEQAPLLLDLGGAAGRHVGRDAAVDHVEHVHRAPLLALGRVDRRQDQVVLVALRRAGLVAGGLGRVERQLGQEALARRRSRRPCASSCSQVGAAHAGVVVQALELRLVPAAAPGRARAGQPARAASAGASSRAKRGPARPRRRRRREGAAAPRTDRRPRHRVEQRAARWPGRCRAPAAATRKPASAVARVLRPAQQRQHVLDVRRLEELQAAELDERDVAPRQLELERGAVVRRCGTAPPAASARAPPSRCSQHLRRRPSAPASASSATVTRLRLAADARSLHSVLGEALGGERDHRVGGVQDRLRRAVVALERDDARRRRRTAPGSRGCCAPSAARNA